MSGLLDKHDTLTKTRSSAGTERFSPCARPLAPPQPVRVDGLRFRQGNAIFRVQGVTYGPFAPGDDGTQFPSVKRVGDDFRQMRIAGINAVRVYHPPPRSLLETAEEHGLFVLIDIPWSKHLCFLNSHTAQREAREAIRSAISAGRSVASVLAYSVCNEIPADIVRWHGARRIERFLRELADLAKQTDPHRLITYANFPPTEYLDLSFADFVTFNVYLHDREVFRRYLRRLQNLVGDKPLVLGELGMDTVRHGELAQAEFLEGHLSDVVTTGLAGGFVFAWTDDWYTGGHQIGDWAFGITNQAREPKASYHAVCEVFDQPPTRLLSSNPKVSVVVCSYNGGRTLDQCLQSLAKLNYPNYEVVVIDDGSTDRTGEILGRFPEVQAIRQSNQGLSAARNVGLQRASGSIVAYTDSDCFVDPDWLTLLVDQLQRTGAAAVGGPNLTPDDGWLASCVAASPGQPTHVLENDQVAEHVPGCNMAFRREALLAINGFDNQYRKAGDDVDICWRLQQAGCWITFAPGAFVWHHRRQTVRAYLRQQVGYGQAEAMLRFQHPDRFNGRGDGKWNGVMYGAALQGIRLERPIIYHGTFGAGMFQCIYQPRPAHWAMLPSTLEWHAALVACLLLVPVIPQAAIGAMILLGLAILVAGMQAAQAKLPRRYDGLASRLTVMGLCYLQPIVRSWARQWTRMFAYYRPAAARQDSTPRVIGPPLFGIHTSAYWSENGLGRQDLLERLVAELNQQQWSKTIDTGWERWDLEVFCHPGAVARIATAQEEHGQGKQLIRVGIQSRSSGYVNAAWLLGVVLAALGILTTNWTAALVGSLIALLGAIGFWRGTRYVASLKSQVNSLTEGIGWVVCREQRPGLPRPAPAGRRASPNVSAKVEHVSGSPAGEAVD